LVLGDWAGGAVEFVFNELQDVEVDDDGIVLLLVDELNVDDTLTLLVALFGTVVELLVTETLVLATVVVTVMFAGVLLGVLEDETVPSGCGMT